MFHAATSCLAQQPINSNGNLPWKTVLEAILSYSVLRMLTIVFNLFGYAMTIASTLLIFGKTNSVFNLDIGN